METCLTAAEKLSAIYGDQWVWVGFEPRNKIVVFFVVGRHIQANADKLVTGIAQHSDGHIQFFTSDELDHYDDALLKVYGIKQEFHRTAKPGRPRKSILKIPKGLLYAQVVKRRERGRVVEITTRVVFGSKRAAAKHLRPSPVSRHINTGFVERNNLTMRHHNRRLVRKTIAFSKKRKRLILQLHLAFAYYHFVKPHLSLRIKRSGRMKKYHNRTPAMAAGFTDHIWSIRKLFSRAVFQCP
ncbi:MAG: hypothetical protein AB1489_15265 [Acidobacteriota bacterium]